MHRDSDSAIKLRLIREVIAQHLGVERLEHRGQPDLFRQLDTSLGVHDLLVHELPEVVQKLIGQPHKLGLRDRKGRRDLDTGVGFRAFAVDCEVATVVVARDDSAAQYDTGQASLVLDELCDSLRLGAHQTIEDFHVTRKPLDKSRDIADGAVTHGALQFERQVERDVTGCERTLLGEGQLPEHSSCLLSSSLWVVAWIGTCSDSVGLRQRNNVKTIYYLYVSVNFIMIHLA